MTTVRNPTDRRSLSALRLRAQRGSGRLLYLLPVILLASAGWSAARQPHGLRIPGVGTIRIGVDPNSVVTDQYGEHRFRDVGGGLIEDAATGLRFDASRRNTLQSAESASGAAPSVWASTAFGAAAPMRISASATDLDAPVVPIGLDASRALEVPVQVDVVGWWSGGASPGDAGPTVLVGHVDSRTGPGVFQRLERFAPGDQIDVTLANGVRVLYEVREIQRHSKSKFPTESVYRNTPRSSLRLITCGGSFDFDTGHYRDNVIVFADLVRIDAAGYVPRPPTAGGPVVADAAGDAIARVFSGANAEGIAALWPQLVEEGGVPLPDTSLAPLTSTTAVATTTSTPTTTSAATSATPLLPIISSAQPADAGISPSTTPVSPVLTTVPDPVGSTGSTMPSVPSAPVPSPATSVAPGTTTAPDPTAPQGGSSSPPAPTAESLG